MGFIFVHFLSSLFWVCWNRAIMETRIGMVWIFSLIAWVLVFVVASSDFLICRVAELFMLGEQSAATTSNLDVATFN